MIGRKSQPAIIKRGGAGSGGGIHLPLSSKAYQAVAPKSPASVMAGLEEKRNWPEAGSRGSMRREARNTQPEAAGIIARMRRLIVRLEGCASKQIIIMARRCEIMAERRASRIIDRAPSGRWLKRSSESSNVL